MTSRKPLDPTRWQRVQAIFHAALALPAAEREACVKRECGDDVALAEAVRGMLAEDAREDSLLDRGIADVAEAAFRGHSELPGDIGPYRMLRLLGEGGMGAVYLAERTDLRNLVAIKLLRDAWASPARRERFTAEQRTQAQLTHPSIARFVVLGEYSRS